MTAENWLYLIIGLVIFNYLFSTVLDFINGKNWRTEIPPVMKDFYPEDKYLKAKNYSKEKGKVSLISSTLSTLITLLFLVFDGYGWLDNFISLYYDIPFLKSGIFFLVLFILSDFISIPFSCYNTFVIEEKYGFNKTTVKTFVLDKIKGYLLTLIIGGVLLFGAIYIVSLLENGFWVWLWLSLSVIMLLVNMFYADLIVPIFNKLTPLENGSLRKKIESYTNKVGYSLKNIYIIDGSKRSSKANAFFSGLGPRKTIALYDTLVEKHTEEELVAVLAHEVGHYKKKHVITSLFLTIFQLGLMCFLLETCLKVGEISQALGGKEMVFHLGLVAFGILYSPVGTIISILMNINSRKNEFEADHYAKTTYSGVALELALKKLSVDSLSNLYPHPFYTFIHYSHPPLLKRLSALNE
ncbi:M48 family metallopeptidase [Flavobacteriales bacterium]|jgi:STE24 endopeptidase|nr:M48 family metallopeptidase [Flavobacteriales bacterium]